MATICSTKRNFLEQNLHISCGKYESCLSCDNQTGLKSLWVKKNGHKLGSLWCVSAVSQDELLFTLTLKNICDMSINIMQKARRWYF